MPRLVLIANTIIFLLALIPSVVPIMFSTMLFDAPYLKVVVVGVMFLLAK